MNKQWLLVFLRALHNHNTLRIEHHQVPEKTLGFGYAAQEKAERYDAGKGELISGRKVFDHLQRFPLHRPSLVCWALRSST